MAKKSGKSQNLVCSDGKPNKFWNIELKGISYTVTSGRVGTEGKSQEKSFGSAEAAEAAFEKLVAEKLKKGYRPASGDSKRNDFSKPKERKQVQPTREPPKARKPQTGPSEVMTTSDRAKVRKLLGEKTTETAQLAFASLASLDLKPSDYSEIFTETVLADLAKFERKPGQTDSDLFLFWECLLAETNTIKPLHSKVCRALGVTISRISSFDLDGLTNLSDAAAEILSKHQGDLSLGGLTSLSEAAAQSLTKHVRYLDLRGLKTYQSS